jgi:hypothetical protein
MIHFTFNTFFLYVLEFRKELTQQSGKTILGNFNLTREKFRHLGKSKLAPVLGCRRNGIYVEHPFIVCVFIILF